MISPFDLDTDRLHSSGPPPRNPWSPVRGRWDAPESRAVNSLASMKDKPTPPRKSEQAAEMVWRNLDLLFPAAEPIDR